MGFREIKPRKYVQLDVNKKMEIIKIVQTHSHMLSLYQLSLIIQKNYGISWRTVYRFVDKWNKERAL